MALNQNDTDQVVIGTDDIYVRALLNAGWRWDPAATTGGVIHWAVDPADNWTPLQIATLANIFGAYAAVANVTFQQVTTVSDAEIVLNQTTGSQIGNFGGYSGTPAEARDTGTDTFSAVTIAQQGQVDTYFATDGFLISGQPNTFVANPDTSDTANPLIISAEGFELMLHEVGHALGLKHPHDGGAVASPDRFPGVANSGDIGNNGLNQSAYTLMSYNHWDPDATATAALPTMATPMAFDIAAIQRLYGANTTTRSGNDTYFLPDPGTDGTMEAIWDTNGVDQIVYNGSASAHIDLRPATLDDSATGGGLVSYTFTGSGTARTFGFGFTIAGDYMNALADSPGITGVIIENAVGGFGGDEFIGNSVDNSWTGNAGDDKSNGGDGTDIAVFNGARADFDTSDLGGGWIQIADHRSGSPDGTNLLSNFEFFEFSNRIYTLAEVLDQPPEAVSDSNGTEKNSTLVVNAAAGVLANDLDDNNAMFVSAVGGVSGNVGHVVKGVYGSLTLNGDGSYIYVPNKGGLPPKIVAQDEFTYTLSDAVGGTDAATLRIAVFNPGMIYSSTAATGGNGQDMLDGSAGSVVLNGGNGSDVLIGANGNILTGGNGGDTFLFRPGFGINVVTDFTENDAIQFDASIFATTIDLFSHTSDTGDGALIDDGSGNTVKLAGVTLAQMQAHADHFYLV